MPEARSVAPAHLKLYAEDEMTLEQMMAFRVNPDHERHVQIWQAIQPSWNNKPYQIRRMLTETSVRSGDRRAIFVGIRPMRSQVAPCCMTYSKETLVAG